MKEKFKRNAIKVAEGLGFTIPSYLVQTGKIEHGKEYTITISDEDEADGGLQ